MDKMIFARRLAEKVRIAEHAIDEALARVSELTTEMTSGRTKAGLAAQAGHRALIDTLAVAATLGTARTQIISSHDRLSVDARRLGIDVSMVGPMEDKPKDQPSGVEVNKRLLVV